MAMQIGPGSAASDPEVMTEINTTPLIDVMLVLLVMLIITIPVQPHAINLKLPVTQSAPPTTPPPVVNIAVNADGGVTWNGEAIADRPALEQHLKTLAAQADQPEVHLRPDRAVEYKSVAAVLASAQRLGVTKIGIIGNEQFAD